ncbi:MAG TPA: hypothetical protein PKI51_05840 [Anaerolineaceae bacterium]|nr:hypothetical protein [Anaerolineaceae bacterium]HOE32920.1 hypothetical protein [Smithella sp.]
MSERSDLLKSISTTIADYREGEMPRPTPEHVERWISQFARDVQLPLLKEVDHVFGQLYFAKDLVIDIFNKRIKNENIAGKNPRTFWKRVNFLRIQKDGHSQEDLLALFDVCLRKQYGIDINSCGAEDGAFIYLDDILFSGNRIGSDLSLWIQQAAPAKAIVHIFVFIVHSLGEWQMMEKLKDETIRAGKKIDFHLWRSMTLENRKSYRNSSEVLWPATITADANLIAYIDQEKKFPFEFRKTGGSLKNNCFSSEEGRQLLEQEFLLAGMKIRALCKNPSNAMRPLGFSAFGLGFGSLIVTYRNCPNNCPLALWWGDPESPRASPLSKWYPLVPRKTYGRAIDFDVVW